MKKSLLILFTALSSSLFTPCKGQMFAEYGFSPLTTGMTSPGAYVLALAMKDSSLSSPLYAGGHFTIAGRDTAINMAEWIDTIIEYPPTNGKWIPLGTGVDSDVCALVMFQNYLYAGGKFNSAGGIASSHIARWDTVALAWDSLLGTLNGNIYALCVYGNQLFAGGDFTIADGITVNRIAAWNGSAWSAVGNGFDSGAVFALTVSNDTLYAGGSFTESNGRVVNHIASWNGTYWDSLGSGTNNTVYALTDYGELVAGGAFTQSGNVSTKYISTYANYSSHTWGSLGSGTNDTVRALDAGYGDPFSSKPVKKQPKQGIGGGNVLLVGGSFDSAGGEYNHYMAAWWGTWNMIGELDGPVFALANSYLDWQGSTYLGGRFTGYGYGTSLDTLNNVAELNIILYSSIPEINSLSSIIVYPNPSDGKFTLQIDNGQFTMDNEEIKIYNVLGEQVYSAPTLLPQSRGGVSFIYKIDLSSQPNGIYLYRVIDESRELIGEGKVIINK